MTDALPRTTSKNPAPRRIACAVTRPSGMSSNVTLPNWSVSCARQPHGFAQAPRVSGPPGLISSEPIRFVPVVRIRVTARLIVRASGLV